MRFFLSFAVFVLCLPLRTEALEQSASSESTKKPLASLTFGLKTD